MAGVADGEFGGSEVGRLETGDMFFQSSNSKSNVRGLDEISVCI